MTSVDQYNLVNSQQKIDFHIWVVSLVFLLCLVQI
jgi:hypothetical protein